METRLIVNLTTPDGELLERFAVMPNMQRDRRLRGISNKPLSQLEFAHRVRNCLEHHFEVED